MSEIDLLVEQVSKFLQEKHFRTNLSWIREKVQTLDESQKNNASNLIMKQILECDWKTSKDVFSELPPGLNITLLNEEKRIFNGNYVLQISGIVDISKAFTENKFEEDSENESENDEMDGNELAKLMKGKSSVVKKKEKRCWSNGKRCLEMALFDGRNECLAMEYRFLPSFHDNLLGAKVLLSGPFDVYAGIILLRPNNIEILSDMTFYPLPVRVQNPNNALQAVPNNLEQNNEENFDDLLMSDELYLDITL